MPGRARLARFIIWMCMFSFLAHMVETTLTLSIHALHSDAASTLTVSIQVASLENLLKRLDTVTTWVFFLAFHTFIMIYIATEEILQEMDDHVLLMEPADRREQQEQDHPAGMEPPPMLPAPDSENVCGICLESSGSSWSNTAGCQWPHRFHTTCLEQWAGTCPMCRA